VRIDNLNDEELSGVVNRMFGVEPGSESSDWKPWSQVWQCSRSWESLPSDDNQEEEEVLRDKKTNVAAFAGEPTKTKKLSSIYDASFGENIE